MARNAYGGYCRECGRWTPPGFGHFERRGRRWLVHCVECERLQGFPDDWTKIPYRGKPADECPDGPRYKAVGNSMAVPVMRFIGERIAMAEAGEIA